ncbi:hypothetical protein BD779DRAFT_1492723 [Infundibulicybe gibba]|nr:hypothetical protein BD779DRAFT_1492723 [Infundibulicybe gibba]
MAGSRGMLAAKEPLVVPMLLRLSHFKLNSYVVLVTDPLQNVDINSTFDSIAVIQKFIQREIEGQLRQMFREDLPGIIHRLSQQWVKAKVEAPYLAKRPPPSSFETRSAPDISFHSLTAQNIGLQSQILQRHSVGPPIIRRAFSVSGQSIPSTTRPLSASPARPPSPPSDNGLPTKSVFRGFSSLFTPSKGLADLAEEPSEDVSEYNDGGSFDILDWDGDTTHDIVPPSTPNSVAEFETIPAVGGGTITRPRIYHSQSMVQTPDLASRSLPGRSRSYQNVFSGVATPLISRSIPRRPVTPDSLETQPSHSSSGIGQTISTPPSDPMHHDNSDVYIHHSTPSRRPSISASDFQSGSPPSHNPLDPDPKIILRPSLNNTIHQLSTLSQSYHTLSPYTRSLEHFTVRSVPPRDPGPSGLAAALERQPVKARRKRMYRLGGKKPAAPLVPKIDPEHGITPPGSPIPPSEFNASDMDRYFRPDAHEDFIPHSPDIHPTHVRRR